MLAAVTHGERSMELVDVPGPASPGQGEVLLRPEVVGVCGSDVHLFHGDLGDNVFPRIQGHEISAVVEAVGPAATACPGRSRRGVARPGLRALLRVQIGRENVCANIAIIGAHVDGALQERLCVPGSQVFAVGDMAPAITAFVEPTSIGSARWCGRASAPRSASSSSAPGRSGRRRALPRRTSARRC